MCYETKRKIADCVKGLTTKKEIRKITIKDIMDETHMSRQSFYYYFKDIYDVLEWIMQNDFTDKIKIENDKELDSWILRIFRSLDKERPFFERIVAELPWNKVLNYMKPSISEAASTILSSSGTSKNVNHNQRINFACDYFTKTLCYYIMDYIISETKFNEIEILTHVDSINVLIQSLNQNKQNSFVYSA